MHATKIVQTSWSSSLNPHRLFTEFVGSTSMLASATLGREWLTQMATGAQTEGLVIQYVLGSRPMHEIWARCDVGQRRISRRHGY